MNTAEALDRLRRRHPQAEGKWATVTELCAVDFVAFGVWGSTKWDVHGYEVKVSRGDWLRELRKPGKALPGMARCDFWWLAAPDGVIRDGELPDGWGMLLLTPRGTRVVTPAPRLRPPLGPRYVDGTLSPDYHFREMFAALARQYAYAAADAAALADAVADSERTAALDAAAVRTGRLTAASRDYQRELTERSRRDARLRREHGTHHVLDDDCPSDCPNRWMHPSRRL